VVRHAYSGQIFFIARLPTERPYASVIRYNSIQGGPRKVKPTTILLVTFECVGKIQ